MPISIIYFVHLINDFIDKIFSLPLPAWLLKNRGIIYREWFIKKVTVFPFFTNAGEVNKVLIVDMESSAIYVVDNQLKKIRVSIVGSIKLNPSSEIPRLINDDDIEELKELWHYDPWWLLDNENFKTHIFRDALKATNCVNSMDKGIKGVFFSNNLTKIAGVLHGKSNMLGFKNLRFKKWNPEYVPVKKLPRKSNESTLQEVSNGWILDPVWTQW